MRQFHAKQESGPTNKLARLPCPAANTGALASSHKGRGLAPTRAAVSRETAPNIPLRAARLCPRHGPTSTSMSPSMTVPSPVRVPVGVRHRLGLLASNFVPALGALTRSSPHTSRFASVTTSVRFEVHMEATGEINLSGLKPDRKEPLLGESRMETRPSVPGTPIGLASPRPATPQRYAHARRSRPRPHDRRGPRSTADRTSARTADSWGPRRS